MEMKKRNNKQEEKEFLQSLTFQRRKCGNGSLLPLGPQLCAKAQQNSSGEPQLNLQNNSKICRGKIIFSLEYLFVAFSNHKTQRMWDFHFLRA